MRKQGGRNLMQIIDVNTIFGFFPREKIDISFKKLLEIMKKYNIRSCFSLSAKGIFYDFEEGNRETLETCKRHPEIIPVATVDPRTYFGKKNIIKNLTNKGFKALRLFPDSQGWPFNYQPFLNIVEEIKENFPLMISISGLGKITEVSKITNSYKIPLILMRINYECFAEALAVMKKYKNVYIETSFFVSPGIYEIFVRELGPERIIFGSYCPFNYFLSSFLSLERAEISDKEKQFILGENIKRFLK